jgi:hypothetical protein
MEPRKIWSIRWTQPYPTNELVGYMESLRDQLIEQVLEEQDFEDANKVISKIMAL